MKETNDEQFAALSHGLTLGQYKDARRLVDTKGMITRQSRALALHLKYPAPEWEAVITAAVRMVTDEE